MTSVSINIDGLSALTKQLGQLSGNADVVVERTISSVVEETLVSAQDAIKGGPKTGTTYYRIQEGGYIVVRAGSATGAIVAAYKHDGPANLSLTHTSSAPGEAPALDTGRLLGSIGAKWPTPSSLSGKVGTDVMYGKYLEMGTSKISPRPWLLPSFEKAKIGVTKQLKTEIEGMVKR